MASLNHDINVMLSGTSYRIASLGIDNLKKELFYSPKTTSQSLGMDLNHDKMAGILDHFSVHQDGTIHEKFKAINRDNKSETSFQYIEK